MISAFRRGNDVAWSDYTATKNASASQFKKELVAIIGELLGTTLFLWMAFAGTSFANIPATSSSGDGNTSNASNVLFIALVFGFSLAINVWIFFRVSGGLFNPAITFSLMLFGVVPLWRGLCLIITQLVGGIIAAGLVVAMFPTPFRASTQLQAGTSVVQGLFIETVLTTQLLLAVFLLAAEKSKSTFLAPIGIGLALFVSEMVGVYYTGGSLNPARSFGPAVVLGDFTTYHWIYWVGPLLGSLLASAIYAIFLLLEYQTVLPDQDAEITHKRAGVEEELKEENQQSSQPARTRIHEQKRQGSDVEMAQ